MAKEKAISYGHCDSLALLAEQHARGEHESECDDEVFEMYRQVNEEGGKWVELALGMCYHYGWGTVNDLNAAVECYARAAELGSYKALDRLYELRNDQSVITSLQNVFRGFCMKVDQGDARAQLNAGYCYFYGIGTPEEEAKARDLFQIAADQKYADAMYMLDWCRERNVGNGYNGMHGIGLLKHAAESGSEEAQYELGRAYSFGETTYGLKVEENYKQAVEWLQRAADENHTWATYNLAYCYYDGYGVEQDVKKAFELYKKAARMGDEDAQYGISNFYSHKMSGFSESEYPVGTDYYEAAYWNRKAADPGYCLDQDILDAIGLTQNQSDELIKEINSFESAKTWYGIAKQYEVGNGVEKDERKAFEMRKLSAKLGGIPAKVALGRCYEAGIGAEVDLSQAAHWYEKAAMEGDHEAADALLNLIRPESATMALKEGFAFAVLAEEYETGNGVPRNEDTALLMREHAAANGDIEEAKMVIEAYISGNGNEYRTRSVGSMIAKRPNLPYNTYKLFIDKFENSIDELDKAQILRNAANSIRTETLGIHVILD